MAKKRYWRPEGWDPVDHNAVVADERGFRRSALFHRDYRISRRLLTRMGRRRISWYENWFDIRPLNYFRR